MFSRLKSISASVHSLIRRHCLKLLCFLYRRYILRRVAFIGITGSTGKTTAKELTATVLGAHLPGGKSPFNDNLYSMAVKDILKVSPYARFYIQEVAAAVGGHKVDLDRFLSLLGCRIGVVTNIGTDHLSAFGSIEAIAEAKSKLVCGLPAEGTAILNADDPLVRAMAVRCRAKVVTISARAKADLWATNVHGAWPEPLTFTVIHECGRKTVRTQLHGKFWIHSVLSALAVALEMGLSLEQAVTAVESAGPLTMRMQPVVRDDGVVFLRDDKKAPISSVAQAFDLLAEAEAKRKLVVVGTLSDYRGNSNRVYVAVARKALEVAERVVFVGPRAHKCLKARKCAPDERLSAFISAQAAVASLAGTFQPGDLVLLKGTQQDRLDLLIDHSEALVHRHKLARRRVFRNARAVVGLGNPGAVHEKTAHNVGHAVLDRLAQDLGLVWRQRKYAQLACAQRGQRVNYLIKPRLPVNDSGRLVGRLAKVFGIPAANWIVVYDDVDLPPGKVQWRGRGSDAGHRGLRSVLQSLETDVVSRVRVGVGRDDRERLVTQVRQPFEQGVRPLIEASITTAVERLKAALETDET